LKDSTTEIGVLDGKIKNSEATLKAAEGKVDSSGKEVSRLSGKIGEQAAFIKAEKDAFATRQKKD